MIRTGGAHISEYMLKNAMRKGLAGQARVFRPPPDFLSCSLPVPVLLAWRRSPSRVNL